MKLKRYIVMMNSMTNEELDSSSLRLISLRLMNESRIIRVARGSGHSVEEVTELIELHKKLTNMETYPLERWRDR